MRAAVITIVAGRHDHLLRQRAALDPNVHHVLVAMGERCRVPGADVIRVANTPQGLPLAQARNAGARRALDAGAELLVFLDVDCIPGPRLLERYRAVGDEPALLCGPVAYLPPASDRPEEGRPHPARPAPYAPTPLHRPLPAPGRLGRKSGAGVYPSAADGSARPA